MHDAIRMVPRFLAVFTTAFLGISLTSCSGPSILTPENRVDTPQRSASTGLSSDYESPVVVGHIQLDDITESSGLAASECQDVLWTHNDAGSGALIFGMDAEGRNLGAWRVEDARNIDWESISSYKEPGGRCVLLIGDIGDNDEARDALEIYRIPEPTVSAETAGSDGAHPLLTEPAESMSFNYPDGSKNAETMLVHPQSGTIYVVTKKESGPAEVFRMEPAFRTGPAVTSEKVADISVPSEPEGRLTGGSMSPDGRRVMLCDLKGGYELVLPEGAADPDAIWQQKPIAVDLGDLPQNEGVSYGRDGLSVFASSEEQHSPLFRIKRR